MVNITDQSSKAHVEENLRENPPFHLDATVQHDFLVLNLTVFIPAANTRNCW